MKYDCKYQSGARSFEPDFGRVINATDGGFERGYAQGRTEGEAAANAEAAAANAAILSDCNAILPEKGVSTADTLEQVPQRIGEIVVEEDMVRYAFQCTFRNHNKIPYEHFVVHVGDAQDCTEMFCPNVTASSDCQLEHISIIGGSIVKAYSMFNGNWQAAKITHITLDTDFSKCTDFRYFMMNNGYPQIVDGLPLNCSSSTTDITINHASQLHYIRFVPLSIPKNISFSGCSSLSADSIQSIIDGLADLTGTTAQTMTLHTTVGAKLTEAQKENIAAKNWTLVY